MLRQSAKGTIPRRRTGKEYGLGGRGSGSVLRVILRSLFVFASFTTVAATAQTVSPEQLRNAASDTSSWLTYGRDFLAQRYADLNQITPKNVTRLQPAWVFATGGDNRGLQATPLVQNGVIY